jgi:hypothetical protein
MPDDDGPIEDTIAQLPPDVAAPIRGLYAEREALAQHGRPHPTDDEILLLEELVAAYRAVDQAQATVDRLTALAPPALAAQARAKASKPAPLALDIDAVLRAYHRAGGTAATNPVPEDTPGAVPEPDTDPATHPAKLVTGTLDLDRSLAAYRGDAEKPPMDTAGGE